MTLAIWDALRQPPREALKQITGGRLTGKTDINPQWRIKAMTEQFGPLGVGWKYTIDKLWIEPGANEEICAFALVSLSYRDGGEWSQPIPGIGGSKLVEKESKGPYTNDECYKMAVTDALSVAMKGIGMAADIYAGLWDGSKYRNGAPNDKPQANRIKAANDIKRRWIAPRHELDDAPEQERARQFGEWFVQYTDAKVFTPVVDRWTDKQIEDCRRQLEKEAKEAEQARKASNADSDPKRTDQDEVDQDRATPIDTSG